MAGSWPSGPEQMVCAVCRGVLNVVVGPEPGAMPQYVHASLLVDHDAQPVPRRETLEIHARCDFCMAPEPGWQFASDTGDVQSSVGVLRDDGVWSACDGCRELIEAGQRQRLLRRTLASRHMQPPPSELPAPLRKQMARDVRRLQKAFFENLQGPATPSAD